MKTLSAHVTLVDPIFEQLEEGGKIIITANDTPVSCKLPVRLSVPQLSCFMRSFYENRAFGTGNKSEIFRFLAASCKSTRQDTISASSIRNHFNCPDQHTITFCITELRRTIAILQGLENRLRRS